MEEKYLIKSDKVPNTIYYIPEFISCDEENYLVDKVYSSPKPKWTALSNRRLQNWGGLPHPKGMIQEKLPSWLQIYCDKISKLDLFDGHVPNHVLVNEYLSGQGIMPHEDGPLFYPTVTTISLNSHTLLNFYKKNNIDGDSNDDSIDNRTSIFSLLLQPRSLLVLKHDAYQEYMHGIEQVTCDNISDKVANINLCKNVKIGDCLIRGNRISLTIRHVPKVLKTKIFNFAN